MNSDYSGSNEHDNNSTSIVIVVQAVATNVVLAVSKIQQAAFTLCTCMLPLPHQFDSSCAGVCHSNHRIGDLALQSIIESILRNSNLLGQFKRCIEDSEGEWL